MSFSKYDPATEAYMDLAKERSLFETQKQREDFLLNRDKDVKKSREDSQYQEELDNITKSLTQKKALDLAKKQKADYESGYVDPSVEALAKINKKSEIDKATESGMTDFQKYSQKNDYDLDNQKKAWESANTFRMREADQSNVAQKDRLVSQLDNQKYIQQAGFNQTNNLRRDDNKRAIDGYNMKL